MANLPVLVDSPNVGWGDEDNRWARDDLYQPRYDHSFPKAEILLRLHLLFFDVTNHDHQYHALGRLCTHKLNRIASWFEVGLLLLVVLRDHYAALRLATKQGLASRLQICQ